MIITLNFPMEQVPWDRFIIEYNGNVMTKALPDSLAVDFKKKIRTAFIQAMYVNPNKLLFPLSEPISMYLEINTNNTFKLPFAVKNIMDALTEAIYFDDVQVISIYARKQLSEYNTMRIGVFTDKHIDEQNIDFSRAITEIIVPAKPCDLILPNRLNYSHTIRASPVNTQTISDIKSLIASQFSSANIINGHCNISMDIYTHKKDADIDNLAIMYFIAMQDMVYERIEDIQKIQIRLFRDNPENCVIRVC